MSRGNGLEGLQIRLQKGKEHAKLTVVTKSMAQPTGELASWEQASKALLLKSYLAERAGNLCKGS